MIKPGKDITPFTIISQGSKTTLTNHKEHVGTLLLPRTDAVAILLEQLEGYFTEIGGYEAVRQKMEDSIQS